MAFAFAAEVSTAAARADEEIFDEGFESGTVCLWSEAVGAEDCPDPYTIDACRLLHPLLIDEVEGTSVAVYGRFYVAGLTDQSGVNDPAEGVAGAVGFGPDGTDPNVNGDWVWTTGAPNPGYGAGSPGYVADEDEYQAMLTVPAAGSYDFAFRFTGDFGATFTSCDGGAGSVDGYSPADAGQMTAKPPSP